MWLGKYDVQFCMQEEIAPTTGMRHIQGYLGFYKKIRARNYFKKHYPQVGKIHWDKLGKGTHLEYAWYCHKDDTRIPGGRRWARKLLVPVVPLSRVNDVLREWQAILHGKLKRNENSRKLFWIYGETGLEGKTWFMHFLEDEHNCLVVSGAKKDMMYTAKIWSEAHLFCTPEFIIIDVPRSQFKEDGSLALSWAGLESLMDGRGFASKYESSSWRFGSQVRATVVFANHPPPPNRNTLLSADRWEVICIRDL